ncbi:600_t:CDS:2, partial [Ambispora leptoticha]
AFEQYSDSDKNNNLKLIKNQNLNECLALEDHAPSKVDDKRPEEKGGKLLENKFGVNDEELERELESISRRIEEDVNRCVESNGQNDVVCTDTRVKNVIEVENFEEIDVEVSKNNDNIIQTNKEEKDLPQLSNKLALKFECTNKMPDAKTAEDEYKLFNTKAYEELLVGLNRLVKLRPNKVKRYELYTNHFGNGNLNELCNPEWCCRDDVRLESNRKKTFEWNSKAEEDWIRFEFNPG